MGMQCSAILLVTFRMCYDNGVRFISHDIGYMILFTSFTTAGPGVLWFIFPTLFNLKLFAENKYYTTLLFLAMLVYIRGLLKFYKQLGQRSIPEYYYLYWYVFELGVDLQSTYTFLQIPVSRHPRTWCGLLVVNTLNDIFWTLFKVRKFVYSSDRASLRKGSITDEHYYELLITVSDARQTLFSKLQSRLVVWLVITLDILLDFTSWGCSTWTQKRSQCEKLYYFYGFSGLIVLQCVISLAGKKYLLSMVREQSQPFEYHLAATTGLRGHLLSMWNRDKFFLFQRIGYHSVSTFFLVSFCMTLFLRPVLIDG
jgi:hypothetical protein